MPVNECQGGYIKVFYSQMTGVNTINGGEKEAERSWADFLFYSVLDITKRIPKGEKNHKTHENPQKWLYFLCQF